MSAPAGLLVLGFGGHARSVADVALAAGIARLRFVDEHARPDERFAGFPVERAWPGALPQGWACLPAAGDNRRRRAQLAAAQERGWALAVLLSPSATVGAGAEIGPGSFVGHHAHVGPAARLGAGCLINTGAVVEHDCVVGACVHVSVHATVAGRCTLGDEVFVGAGAVVIDGITLGAGVTVGAGGVVVAPLREPGTYGGVPARRLEGRGDA